MGGWTHGAGSGVKGMSEKTFGNKLKDEKIQIFKLILKND